MRLLRNIALTLLVLAMPVRGWSQTAIDFPKVAHFGGGTLGSSGSSSCNALTPSASKATCSTGTVSIATGNTVIVFAIEATNVDFPVSMTRTNGSCSLIAGTQVTNHSPNGAIFLCTTTSTGTDSFVVTENAGNVATSMEWYEVTGTTGVIDGAASASGSTGGTAVACSGNETNTAWITASTTDLVIGICGVIGAHPPTVGPNSPTEPTSMWFTNADQGAASPSLYSASGVSGSALPLSVAAQPLGDSGPVWEWAASAANNGFIVALPSSVQPPGTTSGTPTTGTGTSAASVTATVADTTNGHCNAVAIYRGSQTGAVSSTGWTVAKSQNNNAGTGNCTTLIRQYQTGDTSTPVFSWSGNSTSAWVGGAFKGLNGCQVDGTPSGGNGAAAIVAVAPSQAVNLNDTLLTAFCLTAAGQPVQFSPFGSVTNGLIGNAVGSVSLWGYPITVTGTAPTAQATVTSNAFMGMSIPLLGGPTASATATPTASATATLTPTPTATATSTATATATSTATATATSTATATATATSTATSTATATATATGGAPTPTGQCTPNLTINLLNSTKKVMNGTASAVVGPGAHSGYQAVDTTHFIVDAFTGTASGTTGVSNSIVQIVDGHGLVCSGTSDSAVAGLPQFTIQVCDSNHRIAGCTESGTSASANLTVQIQDANGFIDDTF